MTAMPPTPTTPTPEGQKIADAYTAYTNFDNNTLYPDLQNFYAKVAKWCEMAKDHTKSPDVLLEMFWEGIMIGGNVSDEGLDNDGSSQVHKEENRLIEVAKQLNYASAYRDVVSEVKDQLINSKTGTTQIVMSDLITMAYYIDPAQFPSSGHAPEIFQNSSDVFQQAFADIDSIRAKIDPNNLPTPVPRTDPPAPFTYWSFSDLYNQAQQVTSGQTNQASTDYQTFVNGCDSLFSAVGVQQNVLQTQMQDTEADYKSNLSTCTQAWETINISPINYIIQRDISS